MTGLKPDGTEPSDGAVFASASGVSAAAGEPRGTFDVNEQPLPVFYISTRSAVAIQCFTDASRPVMNVNPVARAKEQ
jgi:hypothetical protein